MTSAAAGPDAVAAGAPGGELRPVPGYAAARRFCPDAELQATLTRLCDILRDWAARRGADWTTVLNAGPLFPGRAPHPFRWRVLAGALRACAHRGATARAPLPSDYGALPAGLQEALRWALPAALREPPPVADTQRAAAALADADRLVAALAEPDRAAAPAGGGAATERPVPPRAGRDGERGLDRDPRGGRDRERDSDRATEVAAPAGLPAPEGPQPQGSQAPMSAQASQAGPGSTLFEGDRTEDLLAAALVAPAPASLPPAGAALLAALRAGPVSFAALRTLSAGHGLLPGSVLEALDGYAVRTQGVPATAIEDGAVILSEAFGRLVRATDGQDPRIPAAARGVGTS